MSAAAIHGWFKFRQFGKLLCGRGFPLRENCTVYGRYGMSAILCGCC